MAVYKEIEGSESDASRLARARRLRLESMLSTEVPDRISLLDEAIRVQRATLERSRPPRSPELVTMGNFLLLLLRERFLLNQGQPGVAFVEEGIELSRRLTDGSPEPNGLGEAFAYRLFFTAQAFSLLKEWSNAYDQAAALLNSTIELVPKIQDSRVLALLHCQIADSIAQGLGLGGDELKLEVERAVQAAVQTRDRALMGLAKAHAINLIRWQLAEERDSKGANVRFLRMGELFREAVASLSPLLDPVSSQMLPFVYADFAQSHCFYAMNFVEDRESRLKLIEEDLALYRQGSSLALRVDGFPRAYIGFVGVEGLRHLALFEPNSGKQRDLIAEAIATAETSTSTMASAFPFDLWNIGSENIAEASARLDLAVRIDDPAKKTEMLLLAADRFRLGLSRLKGHPAWTYPAQSLRVGEFNLRLVSVLSKLHELTGDSKYLAEQIQVLDEAEQAYTRGDRPPRVAEVHWQQAKIKGEAGLHTDAAREYERSAESYLSAAKRTPGLQELYGDLSLYMRAWGKIEVARGHHSEESYSGAGEAYLQASSLLKSTQRWSPLWTHYAACATLEQAEALSHEENPRSSNQSFLEAAKLFETFAKTVAERVPDAPDGDEGGGIGRWGKISSGRMAYCLARANLEQAKLEDRAGDHIGSARKFAAAASALERIARTEGLEDSRRELLALALRCKALQAMKEAESTHRAERYAEAAKLFEKVSSTTTSRKASLVARGDVAYCSALEAGTHLISTRETEFYPKTKKYLEAAADYYIEAGMEGASSWTRATERAFDGLVYLARAEGELSPRQKAEEYSLAERSFEASSRLYRDAGYAAKQEQSDRYLKHAREQKQVFISPSEALDGSVILQHAGAQTSPGLTSDESIGMENFQTSNVQLKLLPSRSEITLGESMDLTMEMVSAGRLPAMLVKISDVDPAGNKTELIGEKYRIQDGSIALNGRRLNPFETLELHLRVTPTIPGDLTLSPRVMYLDQEGGYKHAQSSPIALRVVGTNVEKGSIPRLEESANRIFSYLTKVFIDDYMGGKMMVEQAGWRSIPDIARSARLSRSTLYGNSGRYGKALADLLSKGLIETRVSTGHRGRGGDAVKIRIAYDREPVKRHVDRSAVGAK